MKRHNKMKYTRELARIKATQKAWNIINMENLWKF